MGITAYGLVGIFATLQTIFGLLDMGLSATLNREMARLSLRSEKNQEMRNLVRTMELIYWAISAIIGIAVVAIAPLIAKHWLQTDKLSLETTHKAIITMGLAMAFQLPFSFYSGGLQGLQRQVLFNVIVVTTATIRGVGAILILWLVSPTILAFFTWHIVISTLQTFLAAWFLWRSLPKTGINASFRIEILRGIWRFSTSMSGIAVMSVLLSQLDKVILSKLLTMEMFGYYTLSGMMAMNLYRLIGPVSSALYPRLTQLVAIGDHDGLKQLYHQGCQLMSVLILPIAVIVAFFPKEILLLWTRNPTTVEYTSLILRFLIIGTALSGLGYIPYALQLAYGWTTLTFYSNVGMAIILVPFIFIMTPHYGAVGAAVVWVILNSGYVLVVLPIMHRRLLQGEMWRWYVEDVGLPLTVVIMIAGLGRWLINKPVSQLLVLIYLGIVYIIALLMSTLAAPRIRVWVFNQTLK